MSDNLYLNERVAPAQIRYSQMTPLAFNAQSSKRLFFTSNQSTYSNTQTVIKIPISSGTDFLDGPNSYLKFDYVNVEGAAYTHTMSNSANCLFYRVRVIADKGSDLENILYYNQTHAAMADLILGPEARAARVEQGYGTYGPKPLVLTAANYAAGTAAANQVAAALEIRNALALLQTTGVTATSAKYWGCDEVSIAQNGTQTFCVPLDLSALLGPSQRKFAPLFLMGGVTLEITIDPNGPMSSNASAPQFNLKNVEYHAQMITFSADVNQALTAMTQQSGLFMHACSYTTIMNQLASNSSNNWIISERLRSLKSLFLCFQDPLFANIANARSTCRVTNQLQTLQLKLGSSYYPPQALRAANANNPATNGEFLCETFKAAGIYNDRNHTSLLNAYNFGADVRLNAADAAFNTGRAIYGLDLDAFGRSDTESGCNTILNNPITVITTSATGYTNAAGAAAPLNVYNIMYHDVVFAISPDGALTVNK
jgi:hypothetical protein